ncbi:MAG: hypothetical protein F6K62_17585 [Sphaerospermopsis sp. SIO1G2]|nr:hypothetical protein [Sphaerospermopsis sp. SIO1G2]
MNKNKLAAEYLYYKHLLTNVTPTGILSLVSDSYDHWSVVQYILPALKDDVMAREGKLVIRPDSGDPVHILCGYRACPTSFTNIGHARMVNLVDNHNYEAVRIDGQWYELHGTEIGNKLMECEVKGLIECLWDIFGGTETDKGYKLLDEHIGAIYGDAITLVRQNQIIERLIEKGFVPMVVLGVGSFSFQFVTRDTHGSAVKATNVIKAGEDQAIWKDPKTDPGKKSHKGLMRVERENGELVVYDQQTREQEKQGLLETVYLDGKLVRETTLAEIRERMAAN